MPVFDSRSFKNHEQIVFCNDAATGLKAIIAIHSTALGPAAGGCRFWDYAAAHKKGIPDDIALLRGEEDAVYDVLRLSRGMSYKNAMAGLKLGGGKAVIIGNPKKLGTADLMRAFGRHINRLNGAYYTAEDVGTSPMMMEHVRAETDFVAGLDSGEFATGDPSPHTARGIFEGMKAAAKHKFGSDDLTGRTVAIQGVGHVGLYLANFLREAGAQLLIADINQANIQAVLDAGPATVVAPDAIHSVDCDIFSPCALGGGLNSETIPELKAKIVAGAANNQLEIEGVDDEHMRKLDILYAPDYVINAGGIISVEFEVYKQKNIDAIRLEKLRRIGDTLTSVFETSDQQKRPTGVVANEMAEKIIADAQKTSTVQAAE